MKKLKKSDFEIFAAAVVGCCALVAAVSDFRARKAEAAMLAGCSIFMDATDDAIADSRRYEACLRASRASRGIKSARRLEQ